MQVFFSNLAFLQSCLVTQGSKEQVTVLEKRSGWGMGLPVYRLYFNPIHRITRKTLLQCCCLLYSCMLPHLFCLINLFVRNVLREWKGEQQLCVCEDACHGRLCFLTLLTWMASRVQNGHKSLSVSFPQWSEKHSTYCLAGCQAGGNFYLLNGVTVTQWFSFHAGDCTSSTWLD